MLDRASCFGLLRWWTHFCFRNSWKFIRFVSGTLILYKVRAVQGEGVQYRVRVCSTKGGCAVQGEGVQYRVRVCSTKGGCAAQAEGVQYGLRVCSTELFVLHPSACTAHPQPVLRMCLSLYWTPSACPWISKSPVTSYNLRVASSDIEITSDELESTCYNIKSTSYELRHQKHELRARIYEL